MPELTFYLAPGDLVEIRIDQVGELRNPGRRGRPGLARRLETVAMPIFGRDGAGVAWRPDPEAAEASRLAGFLRATGEPSLESLQARAVADPGWFWGAAADDIGIAWERRPRAGPRPERRPGMGALVARRRRSTGRGPRSSRAPRATLTARRSSGRARTATSDG